MQNLKFKIPILLAVITLTAGCTENFTETKTTTEPSLKNETTLEHSYSNPVLIYGSSFGNYMQALYKTGKFEEMLKFTSTESINAFGRNAILEKYKKMNFGFFIKLKSKNENQDGSVTLNYESMEIATRGIFRMKVKIENDTCRIIIENIKSKNRF